MDVGEEELMQYADGVLAPDRAAAVAAAVAADPALARQLRQLTESRRQVAAAFAAAPLPAAPDALVARIRALQAGAVPRPDLAEPAPVADAVADNVVALRARTARAWPALPTALAAGLAVAAIGLLAGYRLGQGGASATADLAILTDPGLPAALASVASGQSLELPSGAVLEPIASFRDGAGLLCREFKYGAPDAGSVVAVACHADQAWDLRLAIAAVGQGDGYAPASSLDTLDAWLTATEAGAPLSQADEQAALGALAAP